VAIEVAGLAVWCGALRRTKLTDEQVPLSLSTSASALPLALGTIGLNHIGIDLIFRIFAEAMEIEER